MLQVNTLQKKLKEHILIGKISIIGMIYLLKDKDEIPLFQKQFFILS